MRVDFAGTAKVAAAAAPVERAWSDAQRAVFAWFETGSGNLVVRARAGTGKTTTIVEGVQRAPERQILLAAFNKSIATELQSRVRDRRVEVKTLHGLGFKFVKRNWSGAQVDEKGERADGLARQAVMQRVGVAGDADVRCVSKLHTKARELLPRATAWEELETLAARHDLLPDERCALSVEDACKCALQAMTLACEPTTRIDFADMIFLPIAMRWVRPWFDLVVVDEAQDMSAAQLELALGACRRSGRVCVVGDDRQAIYGFRGADVDSIDRLKAAMRAAELGLTTTYRCGSLIVDMARAIVPDFACGEGAPLGEIVRRGSEQMVEEATEGDFVVSRTNAPLVKIALAMLRRGVRARIRGRDVGKMIQALVKKLKAHDVASLVVKANAWRQREGEKAAKLKEDAREARLEYLTDVVDVVEALCEGASGVDDVLARADALFADDGRASVWLSTTHRVKGLEATRVWMLVGTFRGGSLEEDNLRYVAITRAKTTLVLVSGYETTRRGREA